LKPAVLDSSALLAYLYNEQGWEKVERYLLDRPALVSVVNVAEVASKLMERGAAESTAFDMIEGLGLQQVDFTTALAWSNARLRVKSKAVGLSLGDRACLALAQSQGCAAVTADKAWLKLNLGIQIDCIR